jgi:hypothetical protein
MWGWRGGNGLRHVRERRGPVAHRFPKSGRKGGWINLRKIPAAVIEQDRYGLFEPSGGQNQIQGVISVDVSRRDAKTTKRCGDPNGLLAARCESKLHPVVSTGAVALTSLDAGYVRTVVSIEIGDRKRCASMIHSDKSCMDTVACGCGTADKASEQKHTDPWE